MQKDPQMDDRLIYLVRHGETDWNVEERCAGQTDIPLNANGRKQAQRISRYFHSRPLAHLIGSDLERTRDTAAGVGLSHDLTYQEDLRWREIHYGILEGTRNRDWPELFPDLSNHWSYASFSQAPPGGESREALIARTSTALEELRQKQPSGPIALFTHGGVIKALLTYTIFNSVDLPLNRSLALMRVDNGSITTLRWKRTKWQIVNVNLIP